MTAGVRRTRGRSRLRGEVLSGRLQDPTNGATHYYSPRSMPVEGKPLPRNAAVSGGLESVPGVTDGKHGPPIRNYRPGWSLVFDPRPVAGILDHEYKFYRQPDGAGRVR